VADQIGAFDESYLGIEVWLDPAMDVLRKEKIALL
jgi:hypothetical protein